MENPGSCLAFETTTERFRVNAKEQEGVAITEHSCPQAAGSQPLPLGLRCPGQQAGAGERIWPGRQVEGGQIGLLSPYNLVFLLPAPEPALF